MRKKLIVGNWKMHGTQAFVREWLAGLKKRLAIEPFSTSVELVVCPPCIYLPTVQTYLPQSVIRCAAQNVSTEKTGAYTGEISADMLREFGCTYVLVGHSERRSLYAETDTDIAKKFKRAVTAGLSPILCIGETLEQRQYQQTQAVLQQQLSKVLAFDEAILQQGLLAYEPVWAIGTGVSASPEQVQSAHQFLRQQIAGRFPQLAQNLPILYGGSVKLDNAANLFMLPDVDGGLVGGASLCADEFFKIYRACVRAAP